MAREILRLNETNKQKCGTIDILCAEYHDLELKYKDIKNDYDTMKDRIKAELKENKDYYTTKFKVVMTVTPEKTEFKYDMEKILKAFPEIVENPAFGSEVTKKAVQTLKSVEKL